MLSAVPADNFSLLDESGRLTQGGTLVYMVVENETANRGTCLTVAGTQLGGSGGEQSVSWEVQAGDSLPGYTVPSFCKTREEAGILPTLRVEDYTDDDYNDVVVKISLVTSYVGTPEPETCDCSCSLNPAVDDGNVTMPLDSGTTPFLVQGKILGDVQPQTMTATVQMGNQTKTVYYDTSTFDSSEQFAVGMNLDTSNLASGRYGWTVTLTYDFGNGVTQSQVFSGAKSIVNRSASPYGAGVNAAGLSSLNLTNQNASTERGINWERSCGKQVWFAFDGTDFTPQAGESAESTLVRNANGTFTLVDQGETFTFNTSGQLLTRVNNISHNTTTWTYNANGTAATKTDAANRVTTFGYTNGKLSSVTDFAGRATTYGYDASGRLTSITQPDPDGSGSLVSPVTSYTYDGTSFRVATETDASGNVTVYTYSEGQVVSKTVNGITQYTQDPFILSAVVDLSETGYDADHLATLPTVSQTVGTRTNLAGNTTQYRYDTFGNVVWQKTASGVETAFIYDTNGRLRMETETVMVNGRSQGRSTEYGYDTHGNLIKIKYSDGSTEQWTYDVNFDQITSYTDQLGNVTLYTLDTATGLTTAERHVVGQIDSAENGETDDVVTTYTYNANRKLASVTDALNVVTTYTYDARGNILTESTGGATTTYTYDTADRTTSVTNALNQTTTYTYDNLDRLVSTTYASGQSSQNVYNNAGQLVQSIDLNGAVTSYTYNTYGKVATITSPGSSVTYTYDSLGRISTETDSLNRVTSYTYNADGKLASTTISDGTQSAVISQTTYDAWGRTATQTDAASVVLAYTYDRFDRVTKITRTNDNVVLETRTYDLAGNLKTVKDALNNVTTYTYDALGNLTQVKSPDNFTTRYTYDKLGRVLTQTDALGNVTSYTYDIYGNLASTTDALGNTVSYVYNAIGQTISSTDALNHVTTYTYDTLGRTTSTTLTSADGLQSTTQSTAYTTQTIDGVKYQIVTTTDALNQVTTSTYDLAGRLVKTTAADNSATTYTYDPESQLLTTTDALNRVTSYTYDTFGNVSTITQADNTTYQYNYNAAGQLLSQTDPLNVTTSYTYNLNGQALTSVVTSGQNSTTLQTNTYDAAGNLLTQTDAMGNTTTYTYDNMGRVTTMTDALSNVTAYTYDKLGRLLTTTDPRGTVTRNIYDAVGNLLETRQYDSNILPTPVNSWLSDGQDFNGTSDSVNLGNDSSLNFEGEITVSAWVKIDTTGGFKAILAHGSAGGKEVYLRLNGNAYQFGSWDSVTDNHLVSASIPAEDIGTWVHLTGTYDGENWNLYRNGELLASRSDSIGCVTVNANWHIGSNNGTGRFFDGEIRDVTLWNTSLDATQAAALYNASVTLTPSEDPEIPPTVTPTTPATTTFSENYLTPVTAYTYDASGQLLSLTDSVGNTTSYAYNYLGLVTSETNATLATRHFTYDALGRLVSKTDRNARTTTYTYDPLGRLTSEKWLSAADTILKTFTYTYDSVGNLLTANDATSSYTYTYDTLNRPLTTTFLFDTQTAAFSYTYDALGRPTQSSLTLNNVASRTNTTTYDYLGRATSIRQHGNITDEIFAEFTHNANGLLTSINRYEIDDNNLLTSIANTLYTYNANNAVTSITHKKPDETSIVQHSYTYDSTNNIISYLNSLDGQTSYNYDFLGQLISADYANQNLTDETYTYDENGNRLTANGSNYTTGTNNELTSDGTWSYVYDDEGNRISKQNSTNRELYTWDHRNRLTKVTQQEYNTKTQEWTTIQIIEYTYDYNNVWIRKTLDTNADGTADSKSIFIPENYQTTVQLDDTDLSDNVDAAVTHRYLWTPQHQDKLLADTTTDGILWSLTDHLGTVRDILSTTVFHLTYDAFGNLTSGTNPILFGYTGKPFDLDTQLQNNINRWFDATIGRWLSTDPIGFEGGDSNLYRYVANDVLNASDTSGLWKKVATYLYYSDKRNDSFESLFQKVQKDFGQKMRPGTMDELKYCVIPVPSKKFMYNKKTMSGADENAMKNKWEQGEIAKCGVYNIKPLLRMGTRHRYQFSIGQDSGILPNGEQNHYIEFLQDFKNVPQKHRNLNARNIYDILDKEIIDGKKQISYLQLIGHWEGNGFLGGFHGLSLGNPTKQRSWNDALQGKVPAIAWFTKDATVQFWGCKSSSLARNFAQNYLRGNAHAYGTNSWLMITRVSQNKYKLWFSWDGENKTRNFKIDSSITAVDPDTGKNVFLWEEF
ncbi:MAG: LamG-like jellyroll fold domain-containing protein [Planctomycetia bacterium]|nr:LamG-like jellyroll fold domain-containing protein [Planctomycetia bacterium]